MSSTRRTAVRLIVFSLYWPEGGNLLLLPTPGEILTAIYNHQSIRFYVLGRHLALSSAPSNVLPLNCGLFTSVFRRIKAHPRWSRVAESRAATSGG